MPDERGGGRTDHDAAGAAADNGYSEWISEVRRLYVEPKGPTEMYGHPAPDEVEEPEHDGPARGWGLPHLGRGRRHEKAAPPAPPEVPVRPSLADLIAAPAPRALPPTPPEPDPVAFLPEPEVGPGSVLPEPEVGPGSVLPEPEVGPGSVLPEPEVEPGSVLPEPAADAVALLPGPVTESLPSAPLAPEPEPEPEPVIRRADRHRARARTAEAQEGSQEDEVDAVPEAREEPVRVRSWFDEGDPAAQPVDAEATPVIRPWTLAEDTISTHGVDALPRRSDRHRGRSSGSLPDTSDTDPSPPVGHAAPSTPATTSPAPTAPAPPTRAEVRAAARREASARGSRRRRALVAALVLLVVVATTWWVMRPTQPVSADTTTAQHSALGLVLDRSATTPLTR